MQEKPIDGDAIAKAKHALANPEERLCEIIITKAIRATWSHGEIEHLSNIIHQGLEQLKSEKDAHINLIANGAPA